MMCCQDGPMAVPGGISVNMQTKSSRAKTGKASPFIAAEELRSKPRFDGATPPMQKKRDAMLIGLGVVGVLAWIVASS